MTAIFAIRHPQTTWNVESRYQGSLEAPWSKLGQEQARLLVRAFEGSPTDAVYTSPLERAAGLAREIASATDAPMEADDRLREIGLGVWQGLQRGEIERRYPEMFRDWYTRPEIVSFPGGETLGEVACRTQDAISDIVRNYPAGNVVIVSHSAVIGSMVLASLGLELNALHRIRLANGGITTLCGESAPGTLLSLNVTDVLYRSPVVAAAQQNCSTWKERALSL
ncbi:MAG TPA: histidine phosphatase family protein [Chloroflexota bacterium]|nr:histidine phosphatase family protein [Chloroflexota bacterium]